MCNNTNTINNIKINGKEYISFVKDIKVKID
mgnify:CR=1 FL=1